MSALYIQALLTLRRKAAGKFHSASRIRAESKLLFHQALNDLSATIDQTAEDDYPLRYHGIINLPRNSAPLSNHIDLLERLVGKDQSIILAQPGKNDDLLWRCGEKAVPQKRNGFWPFGVDASKLEVPPRQRHYRRTRDEVLHWNRLAVMVPDSNVPALVRLLRKARGAVVAIVAADDGVCVIFRTDAQDYPSWQHWCRVLETRLADAGVYAGKISLSTLVPISRESRGRGSLLYLA